MRVIKRLIFFVLLTAVLLLAAVGYYGTRTLSVPTLPVEFTLTQGSSLKSAARQMQQAGVLSYDSVFVWMARMLGKSSQIKAGNYELDQPLTPLQLLDMVTQGSNNQSGVSFIDGRSFKNLRVELNANPDVRHDTAALSETEILRRIGAAETFAEGLFFPDTYYFAKGTSDLAILKRAYQTMQQHLQENWATRDPGLPLSTPYQALILASIVEKETGQTSDRGMIAGVFINRLRNGMMMQTDPTVIYGLGEKFDGNLRKRDLLADTPYNSYTRKGLPPTPISLPGLAALQATLHPAKTDALYFVSRGDGSSEFSATLVQHNRAVNRYQK
ncbi:MAG: endolytic transglycosylase MltG [Pseudomonadota bacterium]